MMQEISTTELRNPRSTEFDALTVEELLAVMNAEDQGVPHASSGHFPALQRRSSLALLGVTSTIRFE